MNCYVPFCFPRYVQFLKKLGDTKNCIHTYYLFTGGSLPDKLDRHPWYLDFPRWHDTRKGNSDRTFASAAQLKAATMQNDVSLTNLKLQLLSTYLVQYVACLMKNLNIFENIE